MSAISGARTREGADVGRAITPDPTYLSQQQVLGALLLAPHDAWRGDVTRLAPPDFTGSDHQAIFGALRDLIIAAKPVDPVTVFQHISRGQQVAAGPLLSYLHQLQDGVASAVNAEAHARKVKEAAVERNIREVSASNQPVATKARRINALASQLPDHAAVRDQAIRIATDRLFQGDQDPSSAPPYPMAHLGPLAEVCKAISEGCQIQPAMVGQCLLGAASLLTQGLFNVQGLDSVKPLSLYMLTLGESGDGKSLAQRVALWSVERSQREQSALRRKQAAAARTPSTRSPKPQADESDDDPPANPYRLTRDATVEGLRRDLSDGPVAQGVFTDEATAILGGYGMSDDQRAKTAGVYCGLWDDGHLSVSRATTGRTERYGLRLATHWLMQPQLLRDVLTDRQLVAQGFWPRFMAAWPDPLQPRKARSFNWLADPVIKAYHDRCDQLLAEPLPDDANNCPVLMLDDEARMYIGRVFEEFERQARVGQLRSIKPFVLRATEQACRVAGVLSAFAGLRSVNVEMARNAVTLVNYSLDTWAALTGQRQHLTQSDEALRLYIWLLDCQQSQALRSDILRLSPVRTAAKRDAALQVLIEHALVQVEGKVVRALTPAEEDE